MRIQVQHDSQGEKPGDRNPTRTLAIGCVVFLAMAFCVASARPALSQTPERSSAGASSMAVNPEAPFHPNAGQLEEPVRFVGRVGDGVLSIGEGWLAMTLPPEAGTQGDPERVELRWLGAQPGIRLTGEQQAEATFSYFLGQDPSRWVAGLPAYQTVRMEGVYPGIDLIIYVREHEAEFDYIVHPGAEVSDIRWTIERAGRGNPSDGFQVDEDGALRQPGKGGPWVLRPPVASQGEAAVAARFVSLPGGVWGLEAGPYDPTRLLLIDPVLSYSSFHGGAQFDQVNAIVTDTTNHIYVAGETWSTDLGSGVPQSYKKSGKDAFIAKFAPDGKTLLSKTYLGGNGDDIPTALRLFGSDLFLAGESSSGDLPGTAGRYQSVNRGGKDGFLTRLRITSPWTVLGTTYLGGAGSDRVNALAIDLAGSVYVAGLSGSSDFPVSGSFGLTIPGGGSDAFVAKFSNDLSALSWSGVYGGGGGDQAYGLALGAANTVWFAGTTSSPTLPTVNAVQTALSGSYDCFLARVPDTGASLLTSTYLGGSNSDFCYALTVDGAGNPIVAGSSASTNFPVTPGVYQPARGGSYDAVLAKWDATANSVAWATYLGGTLSDSATVAYIDTDGAVCAAGHTQSSNFPTMDPVQSTLGGVVDGFLSCVNSTATAMPFSTYLGGADEDRILGVVRRTDTWTMAVGLTHSGNFPTTANARQPLRPGNGDGFVTAIARSGANVAPANLSVTPSSGNTETAELTYLVEDMNGSQDIRHFYGLIHNVVSTVGGCYFRYEPDTNLVYLLNDAGNNWVGSARMGEAKTLSNNQCILDAARSSAWAHATRMSIRVHVSFRPGFGGAKSLLMYVQDRAGTIAGWQLRGGWTVPNLAGNVQPAVTYFQPNSGTFPSTLFVVRAVDANQATDIKELHLLANESLSYPNSCYVVYNQQTNQLKLLNDTTTVFLGPVTPGVSGTLENSSCLLSAGYSAATKSGDSLTLSVYLSFKDTAAGGNNLWTLVSDQSNAFLGWQSQGSFTVPIGPAYVKPAAQSVTVSPEGTKLRFTLTGTDANGGEDIKDFYFLANATLSNPSGCYVLIRRVAEQVLLLNDAGNAWVGSGAIGASQVLENSQCQINLAEVSTSFEGTTAQATLDVQFKAAFTGPKNAWLYVEDNAKLASGWVFLNTFTPIAP